MANTIQSLTQVQDLTSGRQAVDPVMLTEILQLLAENAPVSTAGRIIFQGAGSAWNPQARGSIMYVSTSATVTDINAATTTQAWLLKKTPPTAATFPGSTQETGFRAWLADPENAITLK